MDETRELTRRQLFRKSAGLGFITASLLPGKALFARVRDVCGLTPPQTEGPFYPDHDQADKDNDLTVIRGATARAKGQVIYIAGRVVDETCSPVANALVEIWQACASGRYNHHADTSGLPLDPNFQYWGRATTDAKGNFDFKTILPGHYPADVNWERPPHIHYKVYARGFHDLTTQMYFAGHSFPGDLGALIDDLNGKDLILRDVPEGERDRVIVDFTPAEPPLEAGSYQGNFEIALRRVSR